MLEDRAWVLHFRRSSSGRVMDGQVKLSGSDKVLLMQLLSHAGLKCCDRFSVSFTS